MVASGGTLEVCEAIHFRLENVYFEVCGTCSVRQQCGALFLCPPSVNTAATCALLRQQRHSNEETSNQEQDTRLNCLSP